MSIMDDGYMLSEKDIPLLLEILTPACHKWKLIFFVLQLPEHLLDICKSTTNIISLSKVLNEWIRGNGDEKITLGQLKNVLQDTFVGNKRLAYELISEFNRMIKEEQDITELCKRSPLVKLENIPKIHKMLCSATARWYNIGIMLGVDINKLTEIEMDNVTVLSRLLAVIKRWLHQDINTAWIKLANVMGSKVVNRLDIKKEIMELIESIQTASVRIVEDSGKDIQEVATAISEEPLYTYDSLKEEIEKSKPHVVHGWNHEEYCKSIEYVIWIANENEYYIATTYLKAPKFKFNVNTAVRISGEGRVFVGTIGGHSVGLIKTENQGSESQVEVLEHLRLFPNAKYIISAGACNGFPQEKLKLGDVIVSDKIIDHSNPSTNEQSQTPHHKMKVVSSNIRSVFCVSLETVEAIKVSKNRSCKFRKGAVMSVIDRESFRDEVYDCYEELHPLGVNMEGGVLLMLQSDQRSVIILKGICDFATGKNEKWQITSAKAAFHLLEYQLRQIPNYDQHFPEVKGIHSKMKHPLQFSRGDDFPDGAGVKIAIIDRYQEQELNKKHKSLLLSNGKLKIKIFETTKGQIQKIDTCENISDHALQCTAIAVGEAVDGSYISHDRSQQYKFPGGVAPKAEATLYLVDHSDKDSVKLALQTVKNGKFDVLSLSFGSYTNCKYETELLDILTNTSTIVVVSAGNFGKAAISCTAKLVDKVCFLRERIISVGALDGNYKIAECSAETKQYVTIYQASEFFTPIFDPNCDTLLKVTGGTSMSTPAVAGIICLLIQSQKKHKLTKLYKLEIVNLLKNAIKNNPDKKEGACAEAFLKCAFNDIEIFERGCVQLVAIDDK